VPTHVALLRGINVGGHQKVPMAELREVVASLGHADVATYIQSGNVVFSTEQTDTAALATALEEAIAGTIGVQARVVVLSREDLGQVMRDNPYAAEPSSCTPRTATGAVTWPPRWSRSASGRRTRWPAPPATGRRSRSWPRCAAPRPRVSEPERLGHGRVQRGGQRPRQNLPSRCAPLAAADHQLGRPGPTVRHRCRRDDLALALRDSSARWLCRSTAQRSSPITSRPGPREVKARDAGRPPRRAAANLGTPL